MPFSVWELYRAALFLWSSNDNACSVCVYVCIWHDHAHIFTIFHLLPFLWATYVCPLSELQNKMVHQEDQEVDQETSQEAQDQQEQEILLQSVHHKEVMVELQALVQVQI